MNPATTVREEKLNYLTTDYSLKSWLTTIDHKRIGILYLISISVFFIIGGTMAALVRLELLTPKGDFLLADTYNKAFTMHGVALIFFFLVPSIPAVLGNFLIPMMIGAKDVAFPRLNLLTWYLFTIGGILALVSLVVGGIAVHLQKLQLSLPLPVFLWQDSHPFSRV